MTSFINIEPPRRRPSTSELIGQGFGQGFGGMVQEAGSRFLQGKINQMFANQERERMRPSALALTKSFGLPDATADVIMDHPQILPTLIENIAPQANPFERLMGNAGATQTPSTGQAPIGMQGNVQAAQFSPPISGKPSSLSPPRQIGIPEEGYRPMMKQEEQRQRQEEPYKAQLAQQAQAAATPGGTAPRASNLEEKTGVKVRPIIEPPDINKANAEWKAAEGHRKKQDEIKKNYFTDLKNSQDSVTNHNKDIKEQMEALRGRQEYEKGTSGRIASIHAKAEAARNSEHELKALYSLSAKEGDATKWKGMLGQVAKKYGLDEGAFLNPNDETIGKISANLLPEYVLKKYSGIQGKMFASEINSGMKAIPSLMQTAGGRQRLSKMLLKQNEIPIILDNERKKMQAEYRARGEMLPEAIDFDDELGDRTAEKIAKVHEDVFRIALENPNVPPGKARISIPGAGIQQVPAESVAKFIDKYGAEIVWD